MSLALTELQSLFVDLQSFFSGERNAGALPIPTVQAVAERQTARFGSLNAGILNGCQTASVIWLHQCTNTIAGCDALTDCEIGGDVGTSKVYELTHNLCKTIDFAVDLSTCNNAFTPELLRAQMLAKHIYKIEQDLNKTIVASLASNSETVAAASFPNATVGTAPGGTIADPGAYVNYADASEWVGSIIGELLMGANAEGVFNPYMISGGLLYADYYNAMITNPQCCDPDRAVLSQGPADLVFDTRDLDTTLANSAKNLFIVDPDATAFWSANQFQNDVPQPLNDKLNTYVWRVMSPRLMFSDGGVMRPVYYDVMRQVSCNVGSGAKLGPNGHYTVENYRVIFNGGFHVAPTDRCSGEYPGTSTGIIHVGQGADPS